MKTTLCSGLALLVLLTGCATTYREPVFASSSRALPEDIRFPGVVEEVQANRPLDVLVVHGMCTHDEKWATDAAKALYGSLGGDENAVKLKPSTVSGSKIVLYQQPLDVGEGKIRLNVVVWSTLTTPLKKQLCFDQTERSSYCTADDAPEPYPYKRASLNRLLKDWILNDCLSDALVYQGRARDEINMQMQAAIIQALSTSETQVAGNPAEMARDLARQSKRLPLVVITDSLGSKVTFDAIFKMTQNKTDSNIQLAGQNTFDRIAQIFMRANQLPILALADQNLDGTFAIPREANGYPEDPLGALIDARRKRSAAGAESRVPSVVAFTDPNDLLSFILVQSPHRRRYDYPVVDVVLSNDFTYFGVAELPNNAHLGYTPNRRVKELIACGKPRSERCTK